MIYGYGYRRNYTSKLLLGVESGYGELRIYPKRKRSFQRKSKSMKTLASQQKANEKRSQQFCYLEALENFGSNDLFVTITFSPDMPDKERMDKQKKIIRYLQRAYKKHGSVLKYIYNWGRGEKFERLHHICSLTMPFQRKLLLLVRNCMRVYISTLSAFIVINNTKQM